MDTERDYIEILTDSLVKKSSILDCIIQENEKQKQAVSGEKFNDGLFEETLANKQKYIDELNNIDLGFEKVYSRVKSTLQDDKMKSLCKEKILKMKELITDITGKSLKIQQQEKSNEKQVFQKLSEERINIVQVKNMRKAASDYYRNMNNINYIDPQFMDKKE